jgi:hypothetical protein
MASYLARVARVGARPWAVRMEPLSGGLSTIESTATVAQLTGLHSIGPPGLPVSLQPLPARTGEAGAASEERTVALAGYLGRVARDAGRPWAVGLPGRSSPAAGTLAPAAELPAPGLPREGTVVASPAGGALTVDAAVIAPGTRSAAQALGGITPVIAAAAPKSPIRFPGPSRRTRAGRPDRASETPIQAAPAARAQGTKPPSAKPTPATRSPVGELPAAQPPLTVLPVAPRQDAGKPGRRGKASAPAETSDRQQVSPSGMGAAEHRPTPTSASPRSDLASAPGRGAPDRGPARASAVLASDSTSSLTRAAAERDPAATPAKVRVDRASAPEPAAPDRASVLTTRGRRRAMATPVTMTPVAAGAAPDHSGSPEIVPRQAGRWPSDGAQFTPDLSTDPGLPARSPGPPSRPNSWNAAERAGRPAEKHTVPPGVTSPAPSARAPAGQREAPAAVAPAFSLDVGRVEVLVVNQPAPGQRLAGILPTRAPFRPLSPALARFRLRR